MNSKNPELVVLAAGMGSRYGGLKQIDAVDDEGHIIIDYSIYDAIRAGFRDITFIIKREILIKAKKFKIATTPVENPAENPEIAVSPII